MYSATTTVPPGPATPPAQFVCRPAPDGAKVSAFLFHPDGEQLLLADEMNAVSADAREAPLDRIEGAAAEADYGFDRGAAEADLIAQAGEMAAAVAAAPAGRRLTSPPS